MPLPALAAAARAFDAHDDVALIAALLDVWRATKHPEIADAIERISARMPVTRAVGGKTVAEKNARWLAIASERDPRDLPALLATPWPSKWEDGGARLSMLRAFPPDPRIATALVRLLEATSWTSIGSLGCYRTVASILRGLADGRHATALQAIAERPNKHYARRTLAPILARVAEDARAAQEVAAFAPEDGAIWSSIASALRPASSSAESSVSHDDFLRAIYADPDDEGARRVYADWLVERGDPRGELIVLQCERAAGRGTREGQRREKALLDAHADEWLGALAGVITKGGADWEKGFLVGVETKWHGRDAPRSVTGDPHWSTVRSIALGGGFVSGVVELLDHPVMNALRIVQSLGREHANALLGARERPWRELAIYGIDAPELLATRLPELRHLAIQWADVAEALALAKPVWDRLEVFSTTSRDLDLAQLLAHLREHPGKALRAVRMSDAHEPWFLDRDAGWTLRLDRDADGGWSKLRAVRLAASGILDFYVRRLVEDTLAPLKNRSIRAIEVSLGRKATEADRRPIAAWAKKAEVECTFIA